MHCSAGSVASEEVGIASCGWGVGVCTRVCSSGALTRELHCVCSDHNDLSPDCGSVGQPPLLSTPCDKAQLQHDSGSAMHLHLMAAESAGDTSHGGQFVVGQLMHGATPVSPIVLMQATDSR